MVRFLHTLSIFFAYCIGAALGRKLYKWIFPALLIGVPLKAQQYIFGHDSITFTVDTLEAPKVDRSKPWVYLVKPTLQVYDYWYELANCEGLQPRGAFSRIRFIVINQEVFGPEVQPHRRLWGLTIPDDDGTFTIYLAASIMDQKPVVIHELLHVLLVVNGYPWGHEPAKFFLRCGVYQGGVQEPPAASLR